MIKNQEDDFYREMDKKTARTSCCTCKTMTMLFGVLFIITGIFAFYLFKQIKQFNYSLEKIYPSTASQNSFSEKLQVNPEEVKDFIIVIKSEELTSIASSGIKTTFFEIKEIQAEINQDNITVFGKLIKPIKSDIKIETEPIVEDGRVKLQVKKTMAGKLALPGAFNSQFEKSINKLMDENFKDLYENYQVKTIDLAEDEMVIKGSLKD